MDTSKLNWGFYLIDFFIILAACLTADLLIHYMQLVRHKALDINCDNCEKPLGLKRTPDKKFHLCQLCMKAYITEHTDAVTGQCEFPEELVKKALGGRGYIKRKRSKKGKNK